MVQFKLLELFIKNEYSLAGLYKIYAGKFPKFKDFWSDLTSDEISHAYMIEGFYSDVQKGNILFSSERFGEEPIEMVINHIQEKKVETQKKDITIKDALSTALEIENEMIEEKCFDVFWEIPEELKDVFHKIKKETLEHRDKVKKTLDNLA